MSASHSQMIMFLPANLWQPRQHPLVNSVGWEGVKTPMETLLVSNVRGYSGSFWCASVFVYKVNIFKAKYSVALCNKLTNTWSP